jgi:Tol biopolymer transport system component
MAELKELFDMTTKHKEPDLGSWQEQERLQQRTTRNRRLGAYGAVAALIAGLVVFALVTRSGVGQEQPAGAPTSSPSGATGDTITHHYVDVATRERTPVGASMSGARLLRVSPDGRRVAYNTCCSADAIYVAELDGSATRTLTPTALDGYHPTWVDDETILFQARPTGTDQLGDLYTVDVSTDEMTMVVDLPDERSDSWIVRSELSPDGTTVLFHLPRGQGEDVTWDLWTAPLAGGAPTQLREDAGFATYAPDGSIVFLDHPYLFGGDEIWIMNGDATDARPLVRRGSALSWPVVSPDGTKVAYGNMNGEAIAVVDIATGAISPFDAIGEDVAWYDDDALIVD